MMSARRRLPRDISPIAKKKANANVRRDIYAAQLAKDLVSSWMFIGSAVGALVFLTIVLAASRRDKSDDAPTRTMQQRKRPQDRDEIKLFVLNDGMHDANKLKQDESTDHDLKREALRKLNTGSSVNCVGVHYNNRSCHFENICYRPDADEYFVLHGLDSAFLGVPHERFNPTLLTMSSVQNHNAMYMSYSDLPVSALMDIPSLTYVEDPVFLMKRFKPDNIMHVLHDDIFPLFQTLSELGYFEINTNSIASWEKLWSTRTLVFTDDFALQRFPNNLEWLYQKFSKFKPLHRQSLAQTSVVCFRDAHIGLSKASTWYDYGFFEHQHPIKDRNPYVGGLVRKATSAIRTFLNMSMPSIHTGSRISIFVRSRNRLILNLVALVDALELHFGRYVDIIRMESTSLEEQIHIVSESSYVIGVHGSALIMAAFMPRGSTLVEIFPFAIDPDNYTPYKTLAGELDLNYIAISNDDPNSTRPHPDRDPEQGGISHLDLEIQRRIQDNRKIPKHLCCSDPAWLYRIYSDTRVDIPAFIAKLSSIGKRRVDPMQPYPNQLKHTMLAPNRISGRISCTYSDDRPMVLKIDFQAPFGIGSLKNVIYQVYIEELQKSWHTSDTSILLQGDGVGRIPYGVWVRTYADGVPGPFSSRSQCTPN